MRIPLFNVFSEFIIFQEHPKVEEIRSILEL